MKYEIITVYCVYETLNEFGKLGGLMGIFSSLAKANTEKKGVGWWGSDGDVVEEYGLKIDDEIFLLKSKSPILLDKTAKDLKKMEKEAKKKALEKLTPQEKELLGLEDID